MLSFDALANASVGDSTLFTQIGEHDLLERRFDNSPGRIGHGLFDADEQLDLAFARGPCHDDDPGRCVGSAFARSDEQPVAGEHVVEIVGDEHAATRRG